MIVSPNANCSSVPEPDSPHPATNAVSAERRCCRSGSTTRMSHGRTITTSTSRNTTASVEATDWARSPLSAPPPTRSDSTMIAPSGGNRYCRESVRAATLKRVTPTAAPSTRSPAVYSPTRATSTELRKIDSSSRRLPARSPTSSLSAPERCGGLTTVIR
jgi:hypothetical protein